MTGMGRWGRGGGAWKVCVGPGLEGRGLRGVCMGVLWDFLPDIWGERQRRLGWPLSDSELVEREKGSLEVGGDT